MARFGRGSGQFASPPNLSGLVQHYEQVAREGMGKLGGMVGGAIGGYIGAKPSNAQMSDWYERADNSAAPKPTFGARMKGALLGAAEAGDEEFKRESQEFKGLQDFLEAAHGIPKNATLGKSVGELRGLARGLEAKEVRDMKLREMANDEARQKATEDYYKGIVAQQQARQAQDASEAEADARFLDAVQTYRSAYGEEGDAMAYGLSTVPGISQELRKQVVSGMDPVAIKRANTEWKNALTQERQADIAERKLNGGADDPELRNQYLRLRQSENEAMERWRAKPKDDKLRDEANAATRTRKQFETDFKYAPPARAQQPATSATPRKQFKFDASGNLVPVQ